MKNVIVLTSGLSGSSVVTNLLSKAGYWLGVSTCVKADYNTYENSQLVYLNDLLLKAVGYDANYSRSVKPDKVIEVGALFSSINLAPFKEFIDICEDSGPWLWKDPRLWVTMPFWVQLLEKDSFQVVFVDRSIKQRWISELLRKNIQTYNYCSQYNKDIKFIIKRFIDTHKLNSCDVLFDNLIEHPENTLEICNQFLESSLTIEDLRSVYNKPLYKQAGGLKRSFMAVLIFLKNYNQRLR